MEERTNLPPPGPAHLAEASGAVLSDVLGLLPEGVAVVDASGRLRYANAEAIRIMGFSGPEQLPTTLRGFQSRFQVRDPDGGPVPPERWPAARALAGDRIDDLQYEFVGPDGVPRWARCAGGPVELEGGEHGAWISFRDVGREETILRELREERDLVTALVDLSPLAVAVARAPELILELANDVARALRPEPPMVGRPVAEVFPEAGPAGFLDMLAQVAETGQTVSVEDALLDWSEPGQPRSFSMTFSRLPQPSGRPTRVLIIARETTAEVTARARAEAIAAERSRTCRGPGHLGTAAQPGRPGRRHRLGRGPRHPAVPGHREAARLLGSEGASLFLLDERGDVLVGRAHVGMDDEVILGLRIVLAEWPEVSEVVRSGRPAVHTRADQVRGPSGPTSSASASAPMWPCAWAAQPARWGSCSSTTPPGATASAGPSWRSWRP